MADLGDIFKGKKVAVIRELTKKFEEIIECSAEDSYKVLAKKPRGEYIIIVENRNLKADKPN